MSFNTSFPIDFTGFTAAGFQPVPGAGQLDSDFWRVQGFSDGVLEYGSTFTAPGDYARGTITGSADPTTAGVYAAITGVAGLGTSFVIQPTGAEFGTTPGTITLRLQYTGASPLTGFSLDYDGVFRNNADRSVAVTFSYAVQAAATQPTAFSASVASLGFTTPTANVGGTAAPWSTADLALTSITNTVNTGDYIFLRWTIGDNSVTPGAGSRDEVGFDNISITAGGGAPAVTIALTPASVSLAEGNTGSTAFTYAITRSEVTPGNATVSVTITGGTGFTAADITSVTLDGVPVAGFDLGDAFTVTLTGAATTAALVVNVAGDTVQEANETFNIAIAAPSAGYTLAAAAATGTVLDEDFAATAISTIQGSGTASPLVGTTVAIEGVVTGDYQNGDADTGRNLQGFYVQMLVGDGNAATSDGIFVFQADAILGTNVNVGDIVRVTGTVTEAFNQTLISVANSNTGIAIVTAGAYTPAQVISNFALDVNLPAAGTVVANGRVIPNLEFAEGMLIRIPQTVTISEAFNFDRFGEIRVTQGGQVTQFTQTNLPDSAGYQAYLNDLGSRSLLIDDGLSVQNPNPLNFFGTAITTANAPQIGDGLAGLVGNLGYDFSEYRLQASAAPTIVDTAPRPTAPGRADGDIKIVGTNLLNYFTTLDNGTNNTGPGNSLASRGANNAAELARQTQKLYTTLTELDADLIIVNELENNGFGPGSAIRSLVDGFNTSLGAPGRWSFIDPGVTYLGGDAIKVSMLYRTDRLAVATGTTVQVLDDSDIPGLITASLLPADFLSQSTVGAVFNGVNTSRAVLVASFEQIGSGEVFTAAAVHNKSKSGTGTGSDADAGDGAGNWNNQRALATQALDAFLKTNPTGSADVDRIILGDFNSYAQERSVKFLTDSAGYRNLIDDFIGNSNAASYVFDGQKGYLDYAFGSTSLMPYVRSVAEWRSNSPEFDALDYNTDFGRPTGIFDGTVPYRNSDHDPVVVNLKLDPALLVSRGGITVTVGDSFSATSQAAQAGDTITVRKAAAVTDAASAGIFADNLTITSAAGFNGYFLLAAAVTTLTLAGAGGGTAVGNAGNNIINGDDGDNTLAGNDGNDELNGGNGADLLFGGDGEDTLTGGASADTVYGQDGNDQLDGGAGSDTLAGGLGNDVLNGQEDNDLLYGEAGQDTLSGGLGDDSVYGQDGADALYGDDGQDALAGGADNDTLFGGLGDDTLYGEDGADLLSGDAGNDVFAGGSGDDTVYGGDAGDLAFGEAGRDLMFGGLGNDTLWGQDGDDTEFGEAGGDTLGGGDGNDTLDGGEGIDLVLGEAGNDVVYGGMGQDTLIGGAGADAFYFGSATEGADFIFDFNRTEGDTVRLQGTGFGISAGFQLTDGVDFFYGAGVTPTSATASFYLDTSTNALWFDADGTAAGGPNVVTFLAGSPTLTASDIVFI